MELLQIIIFIVVFLFSAIIHEVSHGLMAEYLGDGTAKMMGRLTLNPIPHLDLFGSIILPILLIATGSPIVFGWAKPVPINPLNFKDKKYGEAKVALAGPLSNILIALFFGLLVRFFPFHFSSFTLSIVIIFSFVCWINLLLAVFNLLPIPPLDGSHVLSAIMPKSLEKIKIIFSQYEIIFMLILVMVLFFFMGIIGDATNFLFKLITGANFF